MLQFLWLQNSELAAWTLICLFLQKLPRKLANEPFGRWKEKCLARPNVAVSRKRARTSPCEGLPTRRVLKLKFRVNRLFWSSEKKNIPSKLIGRIPITGTLWIGG